MPNYYNEIDKNAAAWLRALVSAGEIPPGDVDERDIRDIRPDELRKYTQCHFFAGIGGWPYALKLAGWPEDRPVWTGSCPCQPFSAAGAGVGFADERHLWPHWFHLIGECAPASVFGEQVASKDGLGWLDLVSTDLEGAGYAFGVSDLCAAGIGSPHIRQRLYFGAQRLADASGRGRGKLWDAAQPGRGRHADGSEFADWLGDTLGAGLEGHRGHGDSGGQPGWVAEDPARSAAPTSRPGGLADADLYGRISGHRVQSDGAEHDAQHGSGQSGLADAGSIGRGTRGIWDNRGHDRSQLDSNGCDVGLADASDGQLSQSGRGSQERDGAGPTGAHPLGSTGRPRPLDRFWRSADWLFCRDGKWRPVEPGSQPLVNGLPGRVALLRGYGNAIVPPLAAAFIEAFEEARSCPPAVVERGLEDLW